MNELLLRQALRKDLEWVLACPPVLKPHPTLWQPDQLNVDLSHCIEQHFDTLFAASQGKLGAYFEALAIALFQTSDDWDILAQNEIIAREKKTLGEIDLLLRNKQTDQVLHLELALKFYLWAGNNSKDADGWIGAGLHDFLSKKAKRLYQHQLRLAQIASEQDAWPTHLPKPDSEALWMPGRLYLSTKTDSIPTTPFNDTPWEINPDVCRSIWVEEDSPLAGYKRVLTKSQWLRGKATEGTVRPLPAQFEIPQHPEPVYVVPKGWHTAAQTAITTYKQTP